MNKKAHSPFKNIKLYTRFINHLYMNNVIYVTLGLHVWFQKSISVMQKIAYLDDIANLEILPHGLHFSEAMSFT